MEKQPELFTELKDKGTKKTFFTKGLFPEKSLTFIFTYERLILAAVAFVIILLIIFVFGFECGKNTISKTLPPPHLKVEKVASKEKKVEEKGGETKKEIPHPAPKPYTIQVASFRSKQYAEEEIDKLKKRGFKPTMTLVNGLYEISVGEYSDRKEATQALDVLNKIYKKECIIRKR
ncbi:MAG: SPOR domain-containing protein [Candidatus Omnitrophica bacterium]|nr:SPOR domain-containing protein [Candidatus Omnitrophota bacterium]